MARVRESIRSLLVTGILAATALASAQVTRITSFDRDTDIVAPALETWLSTARADLSRATHGTRAVEVSMQPTPTGYPCVNVVAPTAWNLSAAGSLAMDLRNVSSTSYTVGLKLYDSLNRSIEGVMELKPNVITRCALLLSDRSTPATFGLMFLPQPVRNYENVYLAGSAAFDVAQVKKIQIFTRQPASSLSFVLDNIFTTGQFSFASLLQGTVEGFGQNAKLGYAGKVSTVNSLLTQLRQENLDLAARPVLPDRNRFGGWSSGPKLASTGFFRTETVGNKWTFVDPDGAQFFSAGLNAVDLSDRATITQGREGMFTWLPGASDPEAEFYGTTTANGVTRTTLNFHQMNAARKYGTNAGEAWRAQSLKRLSSWGFNTIGNWSDYGFVKNNRMPYVMKLSTRGSYRTIPILGHGANFPDVYDSAYSSEIRRSMGENILGTDPYLLGYFVDNELPFESPMKDGDLALPLSVLRQSATISPAKSRLMTYLQGRYPTIESLNTAWGVSLASWSAFGSAPVTLSPINGAARHDLLGFRNEMVERYFATVRDELRKLDPNHLYLGCRFQYLRPELAEISAKYVDVVSFNVYADDVSGPAWDFLGQLSKPSMISEFSFGARDSGNFGAINLAANQVDRAAKFTSYVQSVLANPNLIGCHYYAYTDDPVSGRTWKGENGNNGFVSIADYPYLDMVAAARSVFAGIYAR